MNPLNHSKIQDIIGSQSDYKLYATDDTLVSNTDAIGVEIELEGISHYSPGSALPNIFYNWRAVEDGSLRNGTEFIFKEPFKAKNITASLEIMNQFLAAYRAVTGTGVIVNERCSVHVHLDVRELDGQELNNLILVYLLFEKVLFEYISPTRSKNNYCRPLADSSFKATLHNLLTIKSDNLTYDLIRIISRDCDKYSALNVLPVQNFGSVEFRHMPGTDDTTKIFDWINVILALKVAARSFSVQELLAVFKEKDCLSLLMMVFQGTKLPSKVLLSDYETLLSRGVSDVVEILEWDNLYKITQKYRHTKRKTGTESTLLERYNLQKSKELDLELGA